LNTNDAFWPPNPNVFKTATFTEQDFALSLTNGNEHFGSGSRRFVTGGTCPFFVTSAATTASILPVP